MKPALCLVALLLTGCAHQYHVRPAHPKELAELERKAAEMQRAAGGYVFDGRTKTAQKP